MRNSISKIFGIILIAALAACATPNSKEFYIEPTTGPSAILDYYTTEEYKFVSSSYAWALFLDGKKIRAPGLAITTGDTFVKISAGPHTIEAIYVSQVFVARSGARVQLSFTAEEERTYKIRGGEEDGKVFIWLEDTATKEVVARAEVAA